MRKGLADLTPQGIELLRSGATELGISLPDRAVELFAIYYRELIRWNRTVNLTAIAAEKDVVIKHFLDSLSVLTLALPGPLLDIGTGAGFPGVPIKIARPEMEVTLVERSTKKVLFLKSLARALKLTDIRIVEADARAIKELEEFQQRFRAVISRATYSLSELAKIAGPLLTAGGKTVAMKGPGYARELARLTSASPFNLQVEQTVHLTLPFSGEKRALIVMGAGQSL